MSDYSVAGLPSLRNEYALLRIARDRHHIDESTGGLSKARINLNDLCGDPVTNTPSKQRSFSTFMLCNQCIDALMETARASVKEPSADLEPKGAAASLKQLTAIDSGGFPALRIEEEAEKTGRAGHVGIRFSSHVIEAGEPEWRRVRDALISTFSKVSPIDQLKRDNCPSNE